MGLASALSTALTGLTAAETTIDVVGNNLANSNTVGFKASEANFATQFLQTRSLGSAPTTNAGGTNPRQVGLGTMIADITPNFTQGTIEISSNPTDLAIQGDGFFIVQGSSGEELYTRNGILKLNSENQMVTITGNRLLGQGVDDNYQIKTSTSLEPLTIPLGSAAVAQATSNVFLEGTLAPDGDVANTAEIIQTGVLGDQAFTAPASGTTVTQSVPPNVAGPPATSLTGQAGGGSLTLLGTYQYRIVFADGVVGSLSDTEGVASTVVGPATLVGAEDQILLSNIPVDSGGTYSTRRLYRSNDGGTTYNYVAEIADNVTTTYTDTLSDAAAAANPVLNVNTITGNYSYYVTFADVPGGPGVGTESRPTPVIGPQNASGGRIQLGSLPVDASGQWNVRRIYRNLSNDDSTFYFVTEINDATTAGLTFTDNVSDTTISANATIDLDGPRIDNATLLTDVLLRKDSTYTQVFQAGTLEFKGSKGGQTLGAKQLQITSTSTVLDLVNFMEAAVGIQSVPGPDPLNPIPGDTGSGSNPGGTVTANGEIRFVSNNGLGNALSIGGSAMKLTTTSSTDNIDLPFSSSQTAVGESAVTSFQVYDTLGIPLSVTLTAVLESKDSNSTTYRWFADSPDNDPSSGVDITVGTGLITFDGNGDFVSATESTVSIERETVSSASPLEFELDFAQISGLSTTTSSLSVSRQDGSAPGVLTSFIIGEDGTIRGVFSNGITRDLGQIRLARFANPNGLEQKGENVYATSVNSGLAQVNNPGAGGNGSIIAGATELSNTDIGANLIDLILASTMYRGNTRVITTVQQMLDELLSLRR